MEGIRYSYRSRRGRDGTRREGGIGQFFYVWYTAAGSDGSDDDGKKTRGWRQTGPPVQTKYERVNDILYVIFRSGPDPKKMYYWYNGRGINMYP